MYFSDAVTLIDRTYEPDENAIERVTGETRRAVHGDLESVTGEEFLTAGQRGINARVRVKVWREEYHGEKLAEVDGLLLEVYRTYVVGEKIELYLGERVGVSYGKETG